MNQLNLTTLIMSALLVLKTLLLYSELDLKSG